MGREVGSIGRSGPTHHKSDHLIRGARSGGLFRFRHVHSPELALGSRRFFFHKIEKNDHTARGLDDSYENQRDQSPDSFTSRVRLFLKAGCYNRMSNHLDCISKAVMRTTLNIDGDTMHFIMKETGARTKVEDIGQALEDFVRRRKVEKLIAVGAKVKFKADWKTPRKGWTRRFRGAR